MEKIPLQKQETNKVYTTNNSEDSENRYARNEAIRSLFEVEQQVFFILAGSIKYSELKGRYESGSFSTVDQNSKKATGTALPAAGKDRVLAALELHDAFPNVDLITTSRTRNQDEPTYAAVMKDELLQKGVPDERIVLEEESVSTITEYKEAVKLWNEKQWTNIVFVSSNFHLPRARALLNHLEDFADNEEELASLTKFANSIRKGILTIQFLGSAEILSIRDERYKKLFAEVDASEGMQQRIAFEKKGVEQIASGTYDKRNLSKRIWEDEV